MAWHTVRLAESRRTQRGRPSASPRRFVLGIMARAVSEAVDGGLISGTGAAGQPLGIVGTPGVGAQSGAAITWSGILNMLETVETAKGFVNPDSGGWAVVPTVAEIL